MSPHPLPEEGVRPPNGVIAMNLTAQLVLGRAETVPIPARFTYDRQDPFTVLMEIPGPDDRDNSRGNFARDLLQWGLHRPSGEGDVRIWPPCHCNNRPDVRILLCDSTGSALVDFPSQPLREWLVRTWEAVPPGEENAWIDWDAVVGRLLPGC